MHEMKHGHRASVALVRRILETAARAGVDPEEILQAVGLESSTLENPEARISQEQHIGIWIEAINRTGDEDFGLHMGELLTPAKERNILSYVMLNCSTAGEVLEKLCLYHDLMAEGISIRLEKDGSFAYLSLEVTPNLKINLPKYVLKAIQRVTPSAKIKIPRYVPESMLCAFQSKLRFLTENDFNPVEVRFEHPKPNDIAEHQRIFRAPLFFNQPRNELVLEKRCLDLPIVFADPELLDTFEKRAQKLLDSLISPNTWSDKVIRLLGKMLNGNNPGIESVARNLGVSARNLQNRLNEEGTTYQKLLDQVRKEIALDYLKQPDVTICEIAFLLGFSEQSAFNHAFKRWTGSPPGEYRQAMP